MYLTISPPPSPIFLTMIRQRAEEHNWPYVGLYYLQDINPAIERWEHQQTQLDAYVDRPGPFFVSVI